MPGPQPIAPSEGRIIGLQCSVLVKQHERLTKLLNSALREAWRTHGKPASVPRRRGVQRELARAADVNEQNLETFLSEGSRNAGMAHAYIAWLVAPMEIEKWLVTTPPSSRAAIIARAQAIAEKQLMDGGRTPGSGSPGFDIFASELITFIEKICGGSLGKCSKKGKRRAKGRFLSVLQRLEAHLPGGFVPKSDYKKVDAFRRARENTA